MVTIARRPTGSRPRFPTSDVAPVRRGRPLASGSVEPPDTVDGRLGRRVRQLRLDRNWSQEQLADQVRRLGNNWHQTTVAKIEAGERELRYSELLALTDALAVPLATLLELRSSGESQVVLELQTKVQTMRQDELMLKHRLEAVEADLADLDKQRGELVSRLSQVREELPAAIAAYEAARAK